MSEIINAMLHVILPCVIFFFIGEWLSSPKTTWFIKIIDKLTKKKMPTVSPRYTANFIGRVIQFSFIIYFMLTLRGFTSFLLYFSVAVTVIIALLFHIRDATKKSLKEVYSKFTFNDRAIRRNVFVKFTTVTTVTMFTVGALVEYVITPILLK